MEPTILLQRLQPLLQFSINSGSDNNLLEGGGRREQAKGSRVSRQTDRLTDEMWLRSVAWWHNACLVYMKTCVQSPTLKFFQRGQGKKGYYEGARWAYDRLQTVPSPLKCYKLSWQRYLPPSLTSVLRIHMREEENWFLEVVF